MTALETSYDTSVARYKGVRSAQTPALVSDSLDSQTDAYSDALVLRAIAARLRARSLPPTLRRLADLDAALIEQVAANVDEEYTR